MTILLNHYARANKSNRCMFRKICFSKIIIKAGKKKIFPETTSPNNM